MESFRVVFELAEPVLIDRSLAFDGLLAHLAWRRSGDARTAHLGLPLAGDGGVYRASELLFLGPVSRRPVQYALNPRWDKFERGDLADRRGKPLDKVQARDERKPVLDRYEAISARRACALGVGELDRIAALLEGLDAIGKKARAGGFGRLARAPWIQPLGPAPAGFGYADFTGRPIRAVPRDVWIAAGLPVEGVSFGPARPRLPRWATEDELCALPASHILQPRQFRRVGL